MPQPSASGDQQVQVSFRIPANLAADLERVAACEDRTVSAELRRMIRRHVAQIDHDQIAEAA